MRPIVIEVRDGKINMSIAEFRKHVEDAYQQGYSDASLISTTTSPYWWRELTCNTISETAITGVLDTKHTDICADKITATI